MDADEGFFDTATGGPMRLQLARIGTKKYRLCRTFSYRHPAYQDPFVVPADLDGWSCDLASTPTPLTWVVPVLGHHFPAIVLHDALVVDDGAPKEALGPDITREQADGIMRDAMRGLGTGFVRRWLAWAGALVGTVYTKTGVDRRPGLAKMLLAAQIAVIVVLGVSSVLDLFDVIDWVPWMGANHWFQELVLGLIAAVVIPAAFAPFWGSLWRFPLIVGLALAPLLPVLIGIGALVVLYLVLERVFGAWTSEPPPELDPAVACDNG